VLIVLPGSDTASPLTELHWVQSRDGLHPSQQGQDPVSLLPPETDVLLAVPAPLLSWHWVTLPATGAARVRQVLDGLLEDQLLAEPATLHLALQPGLTPGQAGWVCACDKAWLTAWIDVLQAAGRRLVRIVPEAAPNALHHHGLWSALGQAWRVETGPRGVCCTPAQRDDDATPPLQAPACAHLPSPLADLPPWTAEPALTALAERLSGQAATVQTTGQRLLAASQSAWDLAQFELRQSASIRQGQRLLQGMRALAFGPAWRAVRLGLLATVLVTTGGLVAAAWQAQRQIDGQAQRIRQLLTQTFPSVTLVLDAPLQMQREVERLQRASGVAGPADLETFLMDFSASALSNIGVSALVFENGTVTLTLPPGSEAGHADVVAGLQQRGWQVQQQAAVLTVRRAPSTPAAPAGGRP
jgi:general secretion pathway protein L